MKTSILGHEAKYLHCQPSAARVFAGLVGPVFLGLGSGISVSAGFGSFGFSVLLDGVNQGFHIPLWISQVLITLGCYLIAWKLAGIPLGMGTFPALLLIGPMISFGATITPETFQFLGNFFAFVCGLALFSLGISLSAAAALGPDGVTALSLAAEKRLNWPIPSATLLWNAMAITAGVAMGGNFGVATFVGLFGAPLLIRAMLPTLRARIV